MKRSPIWNIIFILGVLYLLVFGFLYVYLRRPVVAEGVDESPPEVVETDELGAEVDIVDAPLLDEDVADEASVDEASTDESSVEDSEANAASETDAAALTEDTAPTGDTAPTEDTTLTTTEPAEAPTPETAVTETAVTEPDVESADEAATQDIADTTEVGTNDTSDDTVSDDTVSDNEETLLGSSPAYRYDLYALAQNARLETEAGWVTLEGELESPQDEQSYFLVVQSLVREPPTLYSQGELSVDEDGQFATRVKYADFGAFYKTYVITTADEDAAQNLRSKGSSVGLPPNFEVIGREVDVLID